MVLGALSAGANTAGGSVAGGGPLRNNNEKGAEVDGWADWDSKPSTPSAMVTVVVGSKV